MNGRWTGAKWLLGCLLFVVTPRCEAQNLIPNPSFEEVDTCPHIPPVTGFGPGSRPTHWFSASDTPDYFNACVDSGTSVPHNIFGYQQPKEGQAYVGHATYLEGDYREMFSVALLSPLVVGQTYYASMFLNSSQGGNQQGDIGCNKVGMLFTTTPYHWTQGMADFPLGDFAQVYSQAVVADTLNWDLVSGSFVADSAYQYVVIGNHFRNALTDTLPVGPYMGGVAYHFVDQVCVSAEPGTCPLATSVVTGEEPRLIIGPNPCHENLAVLLPYTDNWSLAVYDMMGRLVIKEHVHAGSSTQIRTVELSTGEYLMRVTGSREARSLQFVKM
ncbi:MAG: T9SS type A sorting domain-containing protein [Flavobacteriales bacterium]|nr:T9SS type A sorting domain-containing protein [Flavobacteriales bacterium]